MEMRDIEKSARKLTKLMKQADSLIQKISKLEDKGISVGLLERQLDKLIDQIDSL